MRGNDVLLAQLPAVVWVAERSRGREGFVTRFVNDTAVSLLSHPAAAWRGASDFWIAITHDGDRARALRHLSDVVRGEGSGPVLVRWLRADGAALPMEVHLASTIAPSGRAVVRGFAVEVSRWARAAMQHEIEGPDRRHGACRREPVDLNSVVAEVCDALAGETVMRNAALRISPFVSPSLVAGDRGQLTQVVLTLARNALDAVSSAAVGARIVDIAVAAVGDDAFAISVTDTGQERAEPADATAAHSRASGTDVARSVVEALGGHLWAGGNRARGRHVVALLPRHRAT
jgi:hypothetical protein